MQPNLMWLTDPEVFQVNRLDAHSDHEFFLSADEMTQGKSSLRQSLDGAWNFHWSANPAQRPAEFWQADYDDSAFGSIRLRKTNNDQPAAE